MTDKFVITGMTCAACAAHVERAAASVPGVHSASVNLMLGSLVCDHDDSAAPEAIIPAGTGLREWERLIVGSKEDYERMQANRKNVIDFSDNQK